MNVLSLLGLSCIFGLVTTQAESAAAAPLDGERLLTTAEVGALFRVSARTAAIWGAAGMYGSIRTPGRRLLFPESKVRQAVKGSP